MIDLSVIIPIYNVENYLRECLDSVLAQTLQNMQIICINDGSTDSSLDIALEYAKRDSRIEVINKPNSGYGHTCNVGIEAALGRYVAILETDDFIDAGMYEHLIAVAKANDLDIVKCAYYEYFDATDSTEAKNRIAKWTQTINPPKDIFEIKDCPILLFYHPSVWAGVYKRDFLMHQRISFVQTKGASWVDNPFQIQTLCLAKRISYLKEPYYYYRQSNPNASSHLKDFKIPLERVEDMKAFLKAHKELPVEILPPILKKFIRYLLLSVYVGKKQKVPNRVIKTEVYTLMDTIIKEFTMPKRLQIRVCYLRFTPIGVIYRAYALLRWLKHKFLK